jgi:hypothetical protein
MPGQPDLPECGTVSCRDSGAALGYTASVEQTERTEAMSKVPAAQFDRCYCQRDVDDPTIVNCEPQRFILADQSIKLGFFPGTMRLLVEDPPNWPPAAEVLPHNLLHRAIYLTVRGDPSVTFVDATRPLIFGRQADDSPRLDLNCSGTPRADEQPSVLRKPGDSYTLKECAAQNRVQRTLDDVLIDITNPDLGTQPRFLLPTEPLGLQIDRGCVEPGGIHERGTFYRSSNQTTSPDCYTRDTMGNKVLGTYYQYLVTASQPNAQVAAFDLKGNPTNPVVPVLQDVSVPLFPGTDMRRGAFALAPRVSGDLSQPWYVTSRLTGQMSTFRLATAGGPKVVPGLIFSIGNQFSLTSDDVRDVIFEPGSNRAFFAVYTPPSLVVLDTKLRSNNSGVPNNQVTSVTNLCPGPSRLALARVPRQDMGVPTLASRLYATCYLSGQVAEVDADSGELTGTIQIGRGPLDIALNFGATSGIDPCADPYISDPEAKRLGVLCPSAQPDLRPRPLAGASPQIPPRAYVSTYLDAAIAVIDLDPSSPTYRRTTARIGLPSPKKVE